MNHSASVAVGAVCVDCEAPKPIGRVAAAARVVDKRQIAIGRVAGAARVVGKRPEPMAVLPPPLVAELPDGPAKKLSAATVGIADAGQLRGIEIDQPAAVAPRQHRLAVNRHACAAGHEHHAAIGPHIELVGGCGGERSAFRIRPDKRALVGGLSLITRGETNCPPARLFAPPGTVA